MLTEQKPFAEVLSTAITYETCIMFLKGIAD
jgi:hypothetical protein